MKHVIRDVFIFLFDALYVSALYRAVVHRNRPLVRIIAFHDVQDEEWFPQVIGMCVENYNVITPADFHQQNFHPQKINILLTFDDGYQSWIDICVPVLKRYNLRGLFFVNSGLLDISDSPTQVAAYMREHLLISPKVPLTWEGAQTLVQEGHTIGGHSVNHYNLAVLGQHDLEREIIDDKKKIEAKLSTIIVDFAYPFGQKKHRSTKVLQLLRHAGYSSVYTAETGFAEGLEDEIPRMCIEKNQPVSQVQRWVEGGYDLFRFFGT